MSRERWSQGINPSDIVEGSSLGEIVARYENTIEEDVEQRIREHNLLIDSLNTLEAIVERGQRDFETARWIIERGREIL